MKKYKCNQCDYIYDEAKGEPKNKIAQMCEWETVPLSYTCPVCGMNKEGFSLYEEQTTIK